MARKWARITTWMMTAGLAAGVLGARAEAADTERGKKLYDSRCTSCHGAGGSGNGTMEKAMKLPEGALRLIDQATAEKSDAELAVILEKGKGGMPAYKGKLKSADIQDILAYLRVSTTASSGAQAPSGELGPDGQAAYLRTCSSCHGKDAKGSAAMTKAFKLDLAALDLLDEGTLAKKDDELARTIAAGAGKMPAYKEKLDEAAIAAIVAHLRALDKLRLKAEEDAAKSRPAPPHTGVK